MTAPPDTCPDEDFDPETPSLPNLWEVLRYCLRCMLKLFGGPEKLAARLVLDAKFRTHLLAWIAPLEHLARRILLLEAAARPLLPPKKAAAPLPSRPTKTAPRQPAAEIIASPETWRVRLVLAPAPKRAARRRTPSAMPPLGVKHALPIAKRFEALLRLAEHPERHIRAMARALTRKSERIAALAQKPDLPNPCACRFAIEDACALLSEQFSPSNSPAGGGFAPDTS